MKKSSLHSYFHRTRSTVVSTVCIVGIVLGVIAFIFLPGGGPIGLPLAVILGIVFIFSQAKQTRDAEVDALLAHLLGDRWADPDPADTIGAYDLSAPAVKGKDGRLRSTRYVLSRYRPTADGLHISVRRVDLLAETVEAEEHDLPAGALTLTETRIPTSVGLKTRSALTAPTLPADIPVTLESVPAAALVERLTQH